MQEGPSRDQGHRLLEGKFRLGTRENVVSVGATGVWSALPAGQSRRPPSLAAFETRLDGASPSASEPNASCPRQGTGSTTVRAPPGSVTRKRKPRTGKESSGCARNVPNSSSMAMIISTWSKLSKPKSFMKWESAVSCKKKRRQGQTGQMHRANTKGGEGKAAAGVIQFLGAARAGEARVPQQDWESLASHPGRR